MDIHALVAWLKDLPKQMAQSGVFQSDIKYPETIGLGTVRFTFRIAKSFTSDVSEISHQVGDKLLILSSGDTTPLNEAKTLILLVHGFSDEAEAMQYGKKIRLALMIAAIDQSNGIDPGEDVATLQISDQLREEIEKTGARYLPNVHGLQVYRRTGREMTLNLSASGTIRQDPAMILSAVSDVMAENNDLNSAVLTAIDLLSISRMTSDPFAEATLSLAAVESLPSTRGIWSSGQMEVLRHLAGAAQASEDIPPEEAEEVAKAIESSFQSIRQKIKRMMIEKLGMSVEDWRKFDRVYKLRSSLLHGSHRAARQGIKELQSEARDITGQIVMRAVRQLGTSTNREWWHETEA